MSPSDDRLFTPRFFTMCGFTFTVFLSAFQLLPTAPFRILDQGGSTFAAGLFLGLLTYASALSAPFTGALADQIGKRRMLILTSLVLAGFMAAYGFSQTYGVPLEETSVAARMTREKFFTRELVEWRVLAVTLCLFLCSFGYGGVTSFVAVYAEQSGISPKGIFFTSFAITVLVTRVFSGRLAD